MSDQKNALSQEAKEMIKKVQEKIWKILYVDWLYFTFLGISAAFFTDGLGNYQQPDLYLPYFLLGLASAIVTGLIHILFIIFFKKRFRKRNVVFECLKLHWPAYLAYFSYLMTQKTNLF